MRKAPLHHRQPSTM